jgi:hypothetical protein
MDILVLGQVLLGFLAAVAILVNIQLVRLGREYRRRNKSLAPILAAMLLWLPLLAGVIAAGGIALGESSLLSYRAGQDVNGLGWFVLGACLSIFADTIAATIWITMRDVLKMVDATDKLAEAFAILASQDSSDMIGQDEP